MVFLSSTQILYLQLPIMFYLSHQNPANGLSDSLYTPWAKFDSQNQRMTTKNNNCIGNDPIILVIDMIGSFCVGLRLESLYPVRFFLRQENLISQHHRLLNHFRKHKNIFEFLYEFFFWDGAAVEILL